MSRVETYSTMHPEQDSITVNVYQGENHKVKNNILVESFDVPLKKTGAYQSIDIRFSYDINGLLEVDVLLEDGSVKSRVINHSPVTLSAQQIEESRTRLSALKIYPRDMLINRTFKAKLEELWARALGDGGRDWPGDHRFDAALQSNDMARVDEVRRRASVYLAIETS